MAIDGIPPPVITSEIEPVVAERRLAGPGATPSLPSSSGLMGRGGVPPDAIRRRATVPTMAAAQAVVPLNQEASTSTSSLGDLFRMEDQQDRRTLERRGGRRFDDDIDKGIVSRAMEGLAAPDASPSSPGPGASRWMRAPAGQGAAQPAPGRPKAAETRLAGGTGTPVPGAHTQPVVGEASGGSGRPAAPGPRLTRSPHGRPRADSPVHAIADQWQLENSRGPQTAGSSAASVAAAPVQQPGQSSLPAGEPAPIPARRKVSFAHAEQRVFDADDDGKALEEPVRVPFPSDAVLAARGKSAARSSSAEAQANMAASGAEEEARKAYAKQLSSAVGRLQGLAIANPERVQQAIQKGILPAEVLGDRLDPSFVEDVLDLHAQFQEWQATAPDLAQTDFSDAGGLAPIIVAARQDFEAHARNQATLLALMAEAGETPRPPVPQALNDDHLGLVTTALKGRGQALRRMSERAARASPKTMLDMARRAVQRKPKPLEGTRRQDFVALVDRDIAALITRLRIEPQHAADLLQRAVHAGQMGADALRPQDRALLLEVLAAKASNGGG